MEIQNKQSNSQSFLLAKSRSANKSKSSFEVPNEKEIIERICHPNILDCLEIIGKAPHLY